MDYDTMVINDGNIKKTIYILVEINKKHHYIIYTDKILNHYSSDDIFAGEIVDSKIIPVSDAVLSEMNSFITNILKE